MDRALEALTEWDRFAVNRQGHITRVRPYPISVAFPENSHSINESRNAGEERAALCSEMRVEASLLGVGVDRVDYTKGILERFRALERFFELNPAYQQRFTFVQIGAPSRTDIERYKNFLDEVSAEAERINARFQTVRWKPIVFRAAGQSLRHLATCGVHSSRAGNAGRGAGPADAADAAHRAGAQRLPLGGESSLRPY